MKTLTEQNRRDLRLLLGEGWVRLIEEVQKRGWGSLDLRFQKGEPVHVYNVTESIPLKGKEKA